MELNKIYILCFIVILLFVKCSDNEIDSQSDLIHWIADEDNGMVKKTEANNFKLTMKYLPPELLALNETGANDSLGRYEKFLKEFEQSRTFVLSIKNNDPRVDITNYGITDMTDYKIRISYLNFFIKDDIYIITQSGKKIKPVLSTMENIYEIGDTKSIYIVFADDNAEVLKSNTLDIVFEDNITDTGISHFLFEKKFLNNTPTLNFLNLKNHD